MRGQLASNGIAGLIAGVVWYTITTLIGVFTPTYVVSGAVISVVGTFAIAFAIGRLIRRAKQQRSTS
ncbi:MAG: hypothetical protein JOZ47_14545 [Kutzneria sp.]|nr:hypothetical protein [Kutzneria sp.]MBV9846270.1 hypothetical protein [Kutzneria sp.]